MSAFVLHPEAYADLDEIWEYIADDNLDAADRVLEEIRQTIHSLVAFPHQGHKRPDLTSRPLLFHVLRDYVIAYAPDEKPLAVMAVLHGRRKEKADHVSMIGLYLMPATTYSPTHFRVQYNRPCGA